MKLKPERAMASSSIMSSQAVAGAEGSAAARQEAAAARQMDTEEITAETGPFRATAPCRAKAAARVAAARVARSSSSSSSRNVYDGNLESARAVAWCSGDAEEEAATEQPPELRDAEQEASKRVSE